MVIMVHFNMVFAVQELGRLMALVEQQRDCLVNYQIELVMEIQVIRVVLEILLEMRLKLKKLPLPRVTRL